MCERRTMASHCCTIMLENVARTCPDHPDRYDCPDCLVDYWPASSSYGLIIHDGGSSVVSISYCPWCGTKLEKG
jgi:hypothetical protein